MKKEIKLEKGIPIPSQRISWAEIIKQASHGDSILITNQSELAALGASARRLGFKTTSVRESPTTRRVWILKE